MRVDAPVVAELTELTDFVRNRCDIFYSALGFDSLYIYTGLPVPTGLLANWPGSQTEKEQRELAAQLAKIRASGKRLCIVRNLTRRRQWISSSYGRCSLGKQLARYNQRLLVTKHYWVSV